MKSIITIILPVMLLLLSTASNAKTGKKVIATTKLNCKITDQILLESQEGKPLRYSGLKGFSSVGNTLILTINIIHTKTFNFESYTLKLKLEGQGMNWLSINGDLGEHVEHIKLNDVIIRNSLFPYPHVINLSENELSASEHLNNISLERYYKDDWSGIWSKQNFMTDYPSMLTATLNCKTTSRKTIGDIYNMIDDDAFRASPNKSDVN